MKNRIEISRKEFADLLLNWKHGAQPASIQYVTTPKLTKEGKTLFGEVTKVANIGAMIGYNYENAVNNQREREENFQKFMSEPLWRGKGKRLSPALSTHIEKGELYLTYKKQQTFRSFHFDTALNIISNASLKDYFPKTNYVKQDVDKPVYHREIKLANVRKVKFKRTTYILVD